MVQLCNYPRLTSALGSAPLRCGCLSLFGSFANTRPERLFGSAFSLLDALPGAVEQSLKAIGTFQQDDGSNLLWFPCTYYRNGHLSLRSDRTWTLLESFRPRNGGGGHPRRALEMTRLRAVLCS